MADISKNKAVTIKISQLLDEADLTLAEALAVVLPIACSVSMEMVAGDPEAGEEKLKQVISEIFKLVKSNSTVIH